jgi:HEAT repeat protein
MIDPVDSSSSTLRLLASRELARWPLEAIYNLLFDEDEAVRTMAARQLHLRGDENIFDQVAALVSATDVRSRALCAFVLGQLGTPHAPFKEASIPILLQLIGDEQAEVRAWAADAMGRLCHGGMPREVEQALARAACDQDPAVRGAVAIALGNASSREWALSLLETLLQDVDPEVREDAELGRDILVERPCP